MGGELSKTIRPVPDSFLLFSLRYHPKMTAFSVLHAKPAVVTVVEQAINEIYPGVTKSAPHTVVTVLKLPANAAEGAKFWESEKSQLLLCKLIEKLAFIGWRLKAGLDLFLTMEYPEIIFAKELPLQAALHGVFSMQVAGTNRLNIYNASDEVVDGIASCLGAAKRESRPSVTAFTMEAEPWKPDVRDSQIHAVKILTSLCVKLNDLGFELVGNLAVDGDQDTLVWAEGVLDAISPQQYGMIILTGKNGLTFYRFSDDEKAKIEQVVKQEWAPGLDDLTKPGTALHFKLKGTPWWSSLVTSDPNQARLLILTLIRKLGMLGWRLYASLDLSNSLDDKSAFIMRRCEPTHHQIMCLQPVGTNQLWVCNAPTEDQQLVGKVLKLLCGVENIEDEVLERDTGARKFVLAGKPWSPATGAAADDSLLARHTLTVTVAALHSHGWTLLTAADLQGDIREIVETKQMEVKRKLSKKEQMNAAAMGVTGNATKTVTVQSKRFESCDVSTIILTRPGGGD